MRVRKEAGAAHKEQSPQRTEPTGPVKTCQRWDLNWEQQEVTEEFQG